MALTPAQRKALKARAHPLHPLVIIGDKGLTPAVLKEIDVHLKSHELIKVRIAAGERDDREAMSQTICETLDAQPVQHIGKIIVVYREQPEEPQVRNPRPSRATTALKAKLARRRTAEERGQSRRPAAGKRPGTVAKFDAEPARRRSSYEDKDAKPGRRRSSTQDSDAAPARRRSATERPGGPPPRKRPDADSDMEAQPARRRGSAGRPSTAPRKRASAERGAGAAPARGRARSR